MTVRLGLVAGEPSGDLIAAKVLQGLQQVCPDLSASGIGGPQLQAAGLDVWAPMNALSVFGYVDALKSLPRLVSIYRRVSQRWLSEPPDLFLGIDAPDFNLRLEQKLRGHGIPTVHFVGPSIWAWRYERINQIRQAVSHMLVLFPFEVEIYEKEDIPVTYVGHPLADVIDLQPDQLAARRTLGVAEDAKVIAILPGSRASEIRLMAPRFLMAAQELAKRDPSLTFLVPMVNAQRLAEFQSVLAQHPVDRLKVLTPSLTQASNPRPLSWDVMAACDMALVTSGTATLETALFKRPMVISYVLSPWMRRIMAWKSGQEKPTLPWVGLPNVLSRDFVVPELLQDEASPTQLADTFWALWQDTTRRSAIEATFQTLHQTLRCGTAQRAAQAILGVLERSR
jgi:lipid-A-disaccharide synthase